MKKKKIISLKNAILLDLIILAVIGAILFAVETRVTEKAQKENLLERLNSVTDTFVKSYGETSEVTQLYYEGMNAKAASLAYLYDHDENFEINEELIKLYDVDQIYLNGNAPYWSDYIYVEAECEDGNKVILEKSKDELNRILDNIYTQNKVLNRIVNLDELFFIVTTDSGEIVYYPERDYIGKDITELGIGMDDLIRDDAKWLRINKKQYYTSSADSPVLGITITCGIGASAMTTNSHIAVGVLYMVICIVFTVLITYLYFSKQENKREGQSDDVKKTVFAKKLLMVALIGLILISASTYYIQTLFSLSLYTVEASNEMGEIKTQSEEGKNSVEQLTKQYNASYLNKAQIIAYTLSEHPELKTKEELKELSDIFGLQYIMLFNAQGEEILSDSGIKGFVISDDPQSHSYAFNVLKYGIPYVIQEPMKDDLTGEYHQFIGAAMYNEAKESDGFLQIAVSTRKLEEILDDTSLNTILKNSVAGTGDEVIAVDKETGVITFYNNSNLQGVKAVDIGFREDQLKNRYFGYLNLDFGRYYANSTETDGQYVYIIEDAYSLFAGRLPVTLTALGLCLLNMIIVTVFMHTHDVKDLEKIEKNDPYVEVTTPSGTKKKTKNITARMLRTRIEWYAKTPEEKVSIILQFLIGVFAVIYILAMPFRNVIYTDDTIFGFVTSGRWERGFNVFALTVVLITLFVYSFGINIFDFITNEVMKLISPKSETMVRLLKSFIHYFSVIGVIYYCLSLLGFDTASLLASAGLLTLVVGLGAKDLITDILSGIFIIFEHEFQVGDIIDINGFKGRVIEIGVRSTRIINTTQDIKSVNNRNLTNIVNKTRRNSYCDVIINVGFDQDIAGIEKALREELPAACASSPYIIEGPVYGGIDDMSGRTMRLSIRTLCVESYKFQVRTLVNREIKRIFDEHGFKLM